MKTKHLIVDTAGFVKNMPLWEYGEEFYSVPEIKAELRDRATRERFESLPITITMKEPQPWAIRFVNQFSRKTGDYASLSLADMKILALTYELEIEARGNSDHLRTEPQKRVIEGPTPKKKTNDQPAIKGFHMPSNECDNMTNSTHFLDAETHIEDVDTDSSYESTSYDSDSKDSHANRLRDSSSFTRPSSVPEDTINIFWCHMLGIEDFLTDHSYIGGYCPSSDDYEMYKALTKEYPQFRPPRKNRSPSFFFSAGLPASDNELPLHSTFPCIRRWSYHIATFSEQERSLFTTSGKDIGEVLRNFAGRARNREETRPKAPDLIGQSTALSDCGLQVNMSKLSMSDHNQLGESETIERGENERNTNVLNQDLADGDCHSEESFEGDEVYYIESEDNCSDPLEDLYSEKFNGNEEDDEDEEEEGDGDNDDDDDDEGWITPSNIKRHKLKTKAAVIEEKEEEKNVLVACMTSDFSMQNMLKHIGLSVMGVDGKIIRQIRTYILRCHACFKTCSDMSKIFCPKCGNKTLKRVAITINPDGTQKLWINYKRPINKRGMIFTLPKPKGGQHARNPILVADQKEVRQFSCKASKNKINPMHEDYNPDGIPFAVRDVYSRAAQLGFMGGKDHNHYYWERKNPNVHVKKSKNKK